MLIDRLGLLAADTLDAKLAMLAKDISAAQQHKMAVANHFGIMSHQVTPQHIKQYKQLTKTASDALGVPEQMVDNGHLQKLAMMQEDADPHKAALAKKAQQAKAKTKPIPKKKVPTGIEGGSEILAPNKDIHQNLHTDVADFHNIDYHDHPKITKQHLHDYSEDIINETPHGTKYVNQQDKPLYQQAAAHYKKPAKMVSSGDLENYVEEQVERGQEEDEKKANVNALPYVPAPLPKGVKRGSFEHMLHVIKAHPDVANVEAGVDSNYITPNKGVSQNDLSSKLFRHFRKNHPEFRTEFGSGTYGTPKKTTAHGVIRLHHDKNGVMIYRPKNGSNGPTKVNSAYIRKTFPVTPMAQDSEGFLSTHTATPAQMTKLRDEYSRPLSDRLHAHYEPTRRNLSPAEANAFDDYTSNGYVDWNKQLRDAKQYKEDEREKLAKQITLHDLMPHMSKNDENEHVLDHKGKVTLGGKQHRLGDLIGNSNTSHMDNILSRQTTPEDMTLFRGIDDKKVAYKPNTIYRKRGYTSTSTHHNTAETFAGSHGHILHVKVPKGSPGYFREKGGEDEFVLPRNSHLHVSHVIKTPTYTHVHAHLVPAPQPGSDEEKKVVQARS